MLILHIETSTSVCSIALSSEDQLLAWKASEPGMNHTAILAPMISDLLAHQRVTPLDLKAISVNSGPGSYTGLRVGSSTAKGMAYSLGLPILGVPGLYAMAYQAKKLHPDADAFMPMIDARRMEVYTALYDGQLNEIVPPSSLILENEILATLTKRKNRVIAPGDGAEKLTFQMAPSLVADCSIKADARYLVSPAWELFLQQQFESALHFVPFYLKPPNITQPRKII